MARKDPFVSLPIANIAIGNTTQELVTRVQTIVDYLNQGWPIGEWTEHANTANTANSALYANNADFLDGQHGSYYTNASNLITGTLPDARLSVNVVVADLSSNGSGYYITHNGSAWVSAPFPGGGGDCLIANDANHVYGKHENELNVNSAAYANTANNTTYAFGKTEGNLNVNSALYANNATYAFGKTEGNLNVNSALYANNATYAFGKTENNLNVNSAVTANDANNAYHLNGKHENELNVNSALYANDATYAFGKTEGNLNVNNAVTADTANNATYAFGKTEGNLNVNSALHANNATYAFGKTEGNLNVNNAVTADTANNATYAFGKTEGNLNVNSALHANNADYLGGYPGSFYLSNVSLGTLFTGDILRWNGSSQVWYNTVLPEGGGGGGGSLGALTKLDDITSQFNGVQTSFTLKVASVAVVPANAEYLLISLGGVIQNPDVGFTVSGSTIIFTDPPYAYTPFFGVIASTGDPGSIAFSKLDNLTSQFTGAQTVFTLTSSGLEVTPWSPQYLFLSLGGVIQESGVGYTVSGNTVIFANAPYPDMPFFGVAASTGMAPPASYTKLDSLTSQFNGIQTIFTLTARGVQVTPVVAEQLLVSLSGTWQEPNIAYSVSGGTILFATPPCIGASFFAVMIESAIYVGSLTPDIDIFPRNVTASGNVSVAGQALLTNTTNILAGNGYGITSIQLANNATYAYGKTQGNLNVNNAVTADTANNAYHLNGKHESELNVNSALYANNSTYAYGKTEGNLNVNNAVTAGTANNATYAYGKTQGNLNVNNAVTADTANNAYHLNGKHESELNVNNAVTAGTANNATYAYGKTEGGLNTNSALTANNATYAYGKTEGNLNVNSAIQCGNFTVTGALNANGTNGRIVLPVGTNKYAT